VSGSPQEASPGLDEPAGYRALLGQIGLKASVSLGYASVLK